MSVLSWHGPLCGVRATSCSFCITTLSHPPEVKEKCPEREDQQILPSATSSNLFGHDREAPLAPSPSGRGRGVRGPTACGQKPLTLTLSQRERGQETMAKKVIRNRTSDVT